jgi:probable F420-dependent oxidoreductase
MPREFRFGVTSSGTAGVAAWRDQARRIEDLGYSTLYMPDHFGDQLAPMLGLAVAAEATDRLNVGTLVLDNDYRHPLVLAKEAATLDLISKGRFEFGLGAGWMASDYASSGIPYDSPGVRIERMQEALSIMKRLWASADPVSFEGEHYRIDSAVGTPRPHAKPHPRICIGGGGKRILSLAAREADIISVNATLTAGVVGREAAATSTAAAYERKIGWIRDAAGERFAGIELQCQCVIAMVVPNRREVMESMAPSFGISPAEAAQVPLAIVGTVEEICDSLEQRRERFGLSYWVVPDSVTSEFAPVVARLSGK